MIRFDEVVLASANPHKVVEIQAILRDWPLVPRPADVPDVEETSDTLFGNARLKAFALLEVTGKASVADDTGLEVDALDGRPGVRSSRYASEHATDDENVTLLLRELDGVSERAARFRTVALLASTQGEWAAEGSIEGTIALDRRGTEGFGYDSVFVPKEGDGRTFAEMTAAEKNEMSHRGRAFTNLRAAIRALD